MLYDMLYKPGSSSLHMAKQFRIFGRPLTFQIGALKSTVLYVL